MDNAGSKKYGERTEVTQSYTASRSKDDSNVRPSASPSQTYEVNILALRGGGGTHTHGTHDRSAHEILAHRHLLLRRKPRRHTAPPLPKETGTICHVRDHHVKQNKATRIIEKVSAACLEPRTSAKASPNCYGPATWRLYTPTSPALQTHPLPAIPYIILPLGVGDATNKKTFQVHNRHLNDSLEVVLGDPVELERLPRRQP